jgi:hypothetical protein
MSDSTELRFWAAIHGTEVYPGVPLVESYQADPDSAIVGEIAHPEALRLGVRQLGVNLVYCLGQPHLFPDTPEAALTPGILAKTAAAKRVVDMHQQILPEVEEDYLFIGPRLHRRMLGFIALTGIKVVFVSNSGLPGLFEHVVLADIIQSSHRNNTAYWRDIFTRTIADELTPDSFPADISLLAHDDMSVPERQRLGLIGTTYTPGQVIPGANEIFNTDAPVHALCGWHADYHDEVEIAAPVTAHDIRIEDDVLHMPTLTRR